MKSTEIKELTTKEILAKIEESKVALVKLRMNHAVSPLENPNQIKDTRKNVARLKTELRFRELNNIVK
jgi:large subunit ribosomal protein L29